MGWSRSWKSPGRPRREARRPPRRDRSWNLEDLEGRRLPSQAIQSIVSLPTTGATDVISGPDGDLWAGVNPTTNTAEIVRVGLDGSASTFPVLADEPAEPFSLVALATGPDGNVWFDAEAGPGNGKQVVIGNLTPAGLATEFPPIPVSAGFQAQGTRIVSGPDGNLWFGYSVIDSRSRNQNFIGRVTTSGAITLFPITALGTSSPALVTSLAAGADGNLWFTEGQGQDFVFGRMTPGGVVTQFPNRRLISGTVADGLDGNLILTGQTAEGQNKVFQVSPAGVVTRYRVPAAGPDGLLTDLGAADGSLWFLDQAGMIDSETLTLERSPASGAARSYELPDPAPGAVATAASMAVGPDGNLYVLTDGIGSLGDNTTLDRVAPGKLAPAGANGRSPAR